MISQDIELDSPHPSLDDEYRKQVMRFISEGLITLSEWNKKYKSYRDNHGYSIIHYFECVSQKFNCFITSNPIMLDNREDLQSKFKVQILTVEEYMSKENIVGARTKLQRKEMKK